jgi:hypothetical protein
LQGTPANAGARNYNFARTPSPPSGVAPGAELTYTSARPEPSPLASEDDGGNHAGYRIVEVALGIVAAGALGLFTAERIRRRGI